ncbi:DHA2 family efflux MFS transporter permease subunit [Actinomadura sp. LD22]|uniref:DHA2 family efflux MFS transporter permease subunit n=1 Tax=Actinomadura physcomitrii TaxID=2650748 RepID=A0A6I4M108_9ACTN|nr:MFS transporter [Actinomadura physcomitrii]MVZ99597.1 DHA2 family efflux MFS transporter permease subunit [Actinomadura physcomitrii]
MVDQRPAAEIAGHQDRSAGWWPLAAIVAAVFMLMLDATVVTVALPDMSHDLHAGLGDLQWVMNAYTMAMAASQFTAGAFADRRGRRRSFLAGVALFAAASVACGLAPTAAALIAARAVQGLAGALMFATTLALIAQCYTGRARGVAFGVRGTAAGLAVVLGPVVGGALVSALGWRWVFLVNAPVGAVTLAMGARSLPREETQPERRRIDLTGPCLLAVSLSLLVFGLLRVEDHGWGSARTGLVLGASAVAFAAFLAVESRLPDPMLDLPLFRDRAFSGTQIGSFTVQASVFALLVYVSLWFQDQLGLSALETGLCFLPLVVPILVAGPIAGAVMDRLPKGPLVAGSLALLGLAMLLMRGLGPGSSWTHLAPGMALAGLACGIALPTLGGLAVDVADRSRLGMASGVNNTVMQVGSAVGIAVYGALLSGHRVFTDGLDALFATAAAVAFCGAVLTAVLLAGKRL